MSIGSSVNNLLPDDQVLNEMKADTLDNLTKIIFPLLWMIKLPM